MKASLFVFCSLGALAVQAGACPEDSVAPARLLEQINNLRAQGGQCPDGAQFEPGGAMRWSQTLESVATTQTVWMAERDVLMHEGRSGEALGDRARQASYRFAMVAENVAVGYKDMQQVLQAWRTSAKHCRNMLDPRLTEVALACVRGRGGPWWTLTLGRPQATRVASSVSPSWQ